MVKYTLLAVMLFVTLAMLVGSSRQQELDPSDIPIPPMDFDNTCGGANDSESQDKFRNAVELLHAFFYVESERQFQELLDKHGEDNCPVAVWGLGMTHVHFLWAPIEDSKITEFQARLPAALRKAESGGVATEMEIDYLRAGVALYEGHVDAKVRYTKYHDAIQAMHHKYPSNTELQAFLSLTEITLADFQDTSAKKLQMARRAGKRLELIVVDKPGHLGSLHYITHAYDFYALAEGAREYAFRYSKLAPTYIPHDLHMSSHIYMLLGLWDESIKSNELSVAASEKYLKKTMKLGSDYWAGDRIHATKFIMGARTQKGEVASVRRLLEEAENISGVVTAGLEGLQHLFHQFTVETRNWEEAANGRPKFYDLPGWEDELDVPVYRLSIRIMANVRLGRVEEAKSLMEELEKTYHDLRNDKDFIASHNDAWFQHFDGSYKTALAWVKLASGDKDEGLKIMRETVEAFDVNSPEITTSEIVQFNELEGDMLFYAGEYELAYKAYATQEALSPQKFNLQYSLGLTADKLGRRGDAYRHFQKVVELGNVDNVEREELKYAIRFVKEFEAAGSSAVSSLVAEMHAHADGNKTNSTWWWVSGASTVAAFAIGIVVAVAVIVVGGKVVRSRRGHVGYHSVGAGEPILEA